MRPNDSFQGNSHECRNIGNRPGRCRRPAANQSSPGRSKSIRVSRSARPARRPHSRLRAAWTSDAAGWQAELLLSAHADRRADLRCHALRPQAAERSGPAAGLRPRRQSRASRASVRLPVVPSPPSATTRRDRHLPRTGSRDPRPRKAGQYVAAIREGVAPCLRLQSPRHRPSRGT